MTSVRYVTGRSSFLQPCEDRSPAEPDDFEAGRRFDSTSEEFAAMKRRTPSPSNQGTITFSIARGRHMQIQRDLAIRARAAVTAVRNLVTLDDSRLHTRMVR